MTVSYQYEVASSTSGGFTRLLFMWKGSLYKLIYRELVLFLVAFDILSIFYRNMFTEEQKRVFEKLVVYCDTFINLIPLSFVLGFYVAYVATRWWQQYMAIPWPDKIMHTLALYIPGNDEHARILKRSLMRYLNLTLVLILRSISSAVKKRFPTMDHLIEVGFMTQAEHQLFQAVKHVEFNTYWIPCTWFIHHLRTLKEENPKLDAQGLKMIMEEFNEFRSKCGLLWSYDWISIPLVYTQVVTLATYSFFIAALVGRQYVETSTKPLQMEIDIYLPVFTILQFFFFMGLLKVAEQIINPFGNDDEDFELNWLIDRHTKVSYLGVDTMMQRCPPLVKDKYFDDDNLVLPYTGASFAYKRKTFRGSMHYMRVPEEQQNMYLPEIIEEFESEEYKPRSRNNSNYSSSTERKVSSESGPSSGIYWQNSNPLDSKNHNEKSTNNIEDIDIEMKSNMNHTSNQNKGHSRTPSSSSSVTAGTNTEPRPKRKFSFNFNRQTSCPVEKKHFATKHSSFLHDRRYMKRRSDGDVLHQSNTIISSTNMQDMRALTNSGSKLENSKENLNDSHWKGIRWKPYNSCNEPENCFHGNVCNQCRQILDVPTPKIIEKSHQEMTPALYSSYINEGFVTTLDPDCQEDIKSYLSRKISDHSLDSNQRGNADNKISNKNSFNRKAIQTISESISKSKKISSDLSSTKNDTENHKDDSIV